MGVEHEIIPSSGSGAVEWPEIRQYLLQAGEKPVLRMIDGLPAFPDEEPESGWRELRIGLQGGMVTLRRDSTRWTCVTWGNADTALQRSWNALAWAVAKSLPGTVTTANGAVDANQFASHSNLEISPSE